MYDKLVEMIEFPSDDCIVWPHAKSSEGYGRVWVDGKNRHLHRLALQLTKPAPIGKVCSVKRQWVPGHKLEAAHGPCHEPLCFNPLHLSWRTAAENQADKQRDGTHQANENHYNCKVSDVDVDRIRSLYKGPQNRWNKTGPTQTELAAQFGCSKTQIYVIVNGHQRT